MNKEIDWSKARESDTHALTKGPDNLSTGSGFGDVIFVEYDRPHYWLFGVGQVEIGDDAWVVLGARVKS